jgi:hypothetical protein
MCAGYGAYHSFGHDTGAGSEHATPRQPRGDLPTSTPHKAWSPTFL